MRRACLSLLYFLFYNKPAPRLLNAQRLIVVASALLNITHSVTYSDVNEPAGVEKTIYLIRALLDKSVHYGFADFKKGYRYSLKKSNEVLLLIYLDQLDLTNVVVRDYYVSKNIYIDLFENDTERYYIKPLTGDLVELRYNLEECASDLSSYFTNDWIGEQTYSLPFFKKTETVSLFRGSFDQQTIETITAFNIIDNDDVHDLVISYSTSDKLIYSVNIKSRIERLYKFSDLDWSVRSGLFEDLLNQWNNSSNRLFWWKAIARAINMYYSKNIEGPIVWNQTQLNNESYPLVQLENQLNLLQASWRVRPRRLGRKLRKIVRNAYKFTITYDYVVPRQRRFLANKLLRVGLTMSGRTSVTNRLADVFEPHLFAETTYSELSILDNNLANYRADFLTIHPEINKLSRVDILDRDLEDTSYVETSELVENANEESVVIGVPILTRLLLLSERGQLVAVSSKLQSRK